MPKTRYEPLTLNDVLVLKRALALAHAGVMAKAIAEPDEAVAYAMKGDDYFRLYKRITEQPDVATRSI